MDIVTILGSCRQTPIKKYFKTTNILDELNYPHYTKEILQQIRYLKYKNIPEELTKFCFRSGLLTHCKMGISETKYNSLKNEYDNTTFFLVEIASRLTYKWNDLYLHHIATDQDGFMDKENIILSELTDAEIEEDLIQIRNELYPKPFMVISHFATYDSGKRYGLIQLLKNLCEKLNIPFFNQSELLTKYGSGILIKEPVLAHYTIQGNEYAGLEMYNRITQIKKDAMKSTIHQVYYTSENRCEKYHSQGFGDYIRGTMHLYQVIKQRNMDILLKVNFSNHILSNFLVCDNHLSIKECEEEVKYIFQNPPGNILENKYVFTNNFLLSTNIDPGCKAFIIKHCLTPRIEFMNQFSLTKQRLNIEDYTYSIIHVRTEDYEQFNQSKLEKILKIISSIYQKHPTKLLLITNNDIYLEYINVDFIQHTQLKKAHLGKFPIQLEDAQDTMIEFMIASKSQKIYQLSVYEWGSGFSDIIHQIYNVPIEHYRI